MSEVVSSRVPLLDAAAAREAAERVGVLPQLAELNIFRALLQQPDAAKCINDLLTTLLFRGGLLIPRPGRLPKKSTYLSSAQYIYN